MSRTIFRPASHIVLALLTASWLGAADHAESTSVANDPAADLADVFAFVDPVDNTKVVLAMDVAGFIVPSEAANLGLFAPDITYRFNIENSGDATPDGSIDITFSPQTSRSSPQTATISLRLAGGTTFTAPTTIGALTDAAPAFTVTDDATSGASFFAGLTDDPFYFDIVGFNRFVASVLSGKPDAATLGRGRDSVAGDNIHMIAIRVPAALLRGSAGNTIGVSASTWRRQAAIRRLNGDVLTNGPLVQVDRMAVPAVNTALIPFARKNEYNASSPEDDAGGRFAGDIVATLKALGTNDAYVGILAGVAVAKGDYLRLNMATKNSGPGGGNVAGAGFPNGRRPADDVIDTILSLVANGATIGDSVNSNDVKFVDTFPYFAPPQMPRAKDVIDDNTRN